jgi:hypothetical protein
MMTVIVVAMILLNMMMNAYAVASHSNSNLNSTITLYSFTICDVVFASTCMHVLSELLYELFKKKVLAVVHDHDM